MTCLTPDAWWSGYHPQTSRVFPCCESGLLEYLSGMCWGLLDTAKFTTPVLEGLTCCHLRQRALPGSSWQETLLGQQHPGQAHHGRPAEHRSISQLPGPASPQRSQLCHDDVQPDSPSLTFASLWFLQTRAKPCNLGVPKDDAYLQALITREHLRLQQVQVELSVPASNLIWQCFSSCCKFRNNSCLSGQLFKTSNWFVSSWLYTDH